MSPSDTAAAESPEKAGSARKQRAVTFDPEVIDNENQTLSYHKKRVQVKLATDIKKVVADAVVKYLTPYYKDNKVTSKVSNCQF